MEVKKRRGPAVVRICVDAIDSGCPRGRAYCATLPGPVAFSELWALILRLDEIFDRKDGPQAFMRMRTFRKGAGTSEQTEPDAPAQQEPEPFGARDTFIIRVITRQNASWQGTIGRPGAVPARFSSVLELLFLVEQLVANLPQP